MSRKTVEVEIDHGRVIPRAEDTLPEHGRALLTILDSGSSQGLPATETGTNNTDANVHPDILAISGLVPADWSPRDEHFRRLLKKHR